MALSDKFVFFRVKKVNNPTGRLTPDEVDGNFDIIASPVDFLGLDELYEAGSPGADRIAFWDNSASAMKWLSFATDGFVISGTTLDLNAGLDDIDTDFTDTVAAFRGCALDTVRIVASSNGTTITLAVDKSGGGDVRFLFSDGVYTKDCTPAATVTLTAGTDSSPVQNYIYVLQSTKALTASTTGFPATEHAKIATVECQSAASLQTYGAYKVHVWTDHTYGDSNIGHICDINSWIRKQSATWESGVALTPSITTNGGSEDNVHIATTAGVVLQLHDHDFPAFNTATGSSVYIVNKSGAAYTRITDLNAADEDDAGNAITNSKYTNLVIWGVVSEDAADCKLFVNLPSGFYILESEAVDDPNSYTNYSIPADFKGAAFLIARLVLKYTTAASGTWAVIDNIDLRGQFPSQSAGGSTAATTSFPSNAFSVYDSTDPTKKIALAASGITTATTRTFTAPDKNGIWIVDADYSANNTILYKNNSGVMSALTVPLSSILGRKGSGEIAALTTTDLQTLGVALLAGPTFTDHTRISRANPIFTLDDSDAVDGTGRYWKLQNLNRNLLFIAANTTADVFNAIVLSATSVTLTQAGSTKLETASDGVKITGDCYAATDATYDLGTATSDWVDCYLVNAPTVSSDKKKKIDLGEPLGLDFILALKPRKYKRADDVIPGHWESPPLDIPSENPLSWEEPYGHLSGKYIPEYTITHTRPHHGFYAQEVKEAMVTLGVDDFGAYVEKPNGDLALRYEQFIPILTKGIQELAEDRDALRADNMDLRQKYNDLEARLAKLEKAKGK